jgi:hypothetical protein
MEIRFMKKLLIALFPLLLAAGPAEESEKVRKARLENELEKELDGVNEKCGTKLTVSIDWASFDADPKGWEGRSVSGYCEAPLSALARFCEGERSRAYIQKNVETITCHAAKDKAGWKAVAVKGNLHWHVPPDSVNNDAYARAQLLQNL